MANSSNNNANGKRPRDEEDISGRNDNDVVEFRPETKLIRVDSTSSIDSDAGSSAAKANPVDDFVDMDLAEVKKIQEELLNILDESEVVPEEDEERLPAIQGLDSVIKSFEEEIQVGAPPTLISPVIETVSESGESSQPELGYLLEASDDELGLPPTNSDEGAASNNEEKKMMEVSDFTASPPAADFAGTVGFENDVIPSYDAFDFGMGAYNSESNDVGGEYVVWGGLFDYYSDVGGGVLDPEAPWRTESLSAL